MRHCVISTPIAGHSFTPDIPIYLNIPEIASYTTITPTVTGYSTVTNGPGDYDFSFTTNALGTYYIVLDSNVDGIYDLSSDEVVASGASDVGYNLVSWNGLDFSGNPIAPGIYSSQVRLHIGELHYIANDVETSYEGLRLLQLDSIGNRIPMNMYWNDVMVQSNAILMPNSQYGLEVSGSAGINSGDYVDAVNPNVNARSWGNFSGNTGKGNDSFLNTFVWISDDVSSNGEIEILDPPGYSCNVNMISDTTESFDAIREACEILILGPDYIVADSSNVSANSGWEIDFMPGFIVEQGATLNANVCGQSLCLTSPSPMPLGCHSCVDLICASDASCCGIAFDQECLDMVDSVCHFVCE